MTKKADTPKKKDHKHKEQLVLDYHKKPSLKLRDQIVKEFTPLVEYIARKLSFQWEDVPDLAQVGSIGLLKSLKNFDPEKKVNFSTFASANIIGEIKHYLRDKSKIVKLPRRLQEHYYKIRQYIKVALQELGRQPTIQEIAKALDLDEEIILESLEAGQSSQVISLDKPMYVQGSSKDGAENYSLIDSLGTDFKDEQMLNQETLKQALHTLPEREKKVIYLRFYEGLTQKEIAQRFNLSQMHISRIITNAISLLRSKLTKEIG